MSVDSGKGRLDAMWDAENGVLPFAIERRRLVTVGGRLLPLRS